MKINSKIVFLGVGGIGMSALARYFMALGKTVYGYDRTKSHLVEELVQAGLIFTDESNLSSLPLEELTLENTTIIVTPAIPENQEGRQYFVSQGFDLHKRSAVLGAITKRSENLSVAGTHGKTTTSSILAHLLCQSEKPMVGFVGGILKNYESNYITNSKALTEAHFSVTEADEYDRSFLQLAPKHAIITSVEADHLDIYGEEEALLSSFREFADLVHQEGELIVHHSIAHEFSAKRTVKTYGIGQGQIRAENTHVHEGVQVFDVYIENDVWRHMQFKLPGHHNLENALAAIGLAYFAAGLSEAEIRESLKSYEGVQRRFDRTENKGKVYIDDYAHHPSELKAAIQAARQFYPGKKITGVFQPHLFTRTRDFMDEFAAALSNLDCVLLLDIYPAREEPIEGVDSSALLAKISNSNKQLLSPEEVIAYAKRRTPDVLMTLGAGDIDRLVPTLKEWYGKA
jgi:UDP-N-acetylmuramate--alanine ligase